MSASNQKLKQNTSAFTTIFFLLIVALGCSKFSELTIKTSTGGNSNSTANSSANTPKTVPASTTSPPTPGFEKFALVEVGDYTMEQAFSVFNKNDGYLRNVDYRYKYTDKRNASMHGQYGVDAQMVIREYDSAQKVEKMLKDRIAESVPLASAGKVKLPKCVGEKSDSDEFIGPEKLVKRVKIAGGGELVVFRDGDFNMFDCERGSNYGESAAWTDGAYYFSVFSMAYHTRRDEPGGTGYDRAEEFARQYLKALGKQVESE